jgi:site-specific recombinase XerD
MTSDNKRSSTVGQKALKGTSKVTEARARAQRVKHDNHVQAQAEKADHAAASKKAGSREAQSKRRGDNLERAIDDYLQDHEGGNHSRKTVEWHRTALGLMQAYLHQEHEILEVDEVEGSHISAWFSHLRKTPGANGKIRSERTIQTYARSARAFFHWLVHRGALTLNPFDRVVFPKVGKPLIQTITTEEFEKLLYACTPPNETGPIAQRASVRNRAILWLLYDTGIRVSELTNLRVGDLDRKHGLITVLGKGSKERRIALGQNCLRNVLYYLDKHRPDAQELAEWGSVGEDHAFLSETRQPLTMWLLCWMVDTWLLSGEMRCYSKIQLSIDG